MPLKQAKLKVLLTIPTEIHKSLVDGCDTKSAEYLILRNGVIGFAEETTSMVTILCEPERASKLIAWVKQMHPDAAHLITASPAPSA